LSTRPSPRQRNSQKEKDAIKAGEIPEAWKDKPAKLAQKDRDARWTVKYSKAKQPTETPTLSPTKTHDIAIPVFGYKNHAGIDRAHGFIRAWTVTSASAHDGAQLRNVVIKDNTASTVWADSAYRSKTNEEWLTKNGMKSEIHQKKPKSKPMPEAMSKANGRRSKIRSAVEHVFARQKDKMKLFIRTIGIGRARVKIGMANIAYNMLRYVFHEGKRATA
jgi:transposase, IS5 family